MDSQEYEWAVYDENGNYIKTVKNQLEAHTEEKQTCPLP